MRTWKCICGTENRVCYEVCCSCQAQMPVSERRRICAEVRALLRPGVQKEKDLCTKNRLKKTESSVMKCRGLFRALQIVSVAAIIGFLWYTKAYADILAKLQHTGEMSLGRIDTVQAVFASLKAAAGETAQDVQGLGQQLLLRLERAKGIPAAVESILRDLPQLRIQRPEKLTDVWENLQEIGERIHEIKESVVYYAEYVIGKHR